MAATTFATSLSLIEDKVMGELIMEYVIKPDPLASLIPMRYSGSAQWRQKLLSEPAGAAAQRFDATVAASAFTEFEYQAFLNMVAKRDDRLMGIESVPPGDVGVSDRLTKKAVVIAAMSKSYRQLLQVGDPVGTATVGANITALGVTAVEPGPRHASFSDVHGAAAVTVIYGTFKWVAASKTLYYMAPGDATWGTGVVLSATKFYRVPLRSASYGKWIYVTVDWATINAAGNYTGDVAVAADRIAWTPTTEPTGLLKQIDPDLRVFGNLSTTNPTAAGDALGQKNLMWLAGKLLDGANDDPAKCIILMNENVFLNAGVLLTGLGYGNRTVEFMGRQFNSLSFMGIPIIKSPWVLQNKTSSSGAVTNLSSVYGLIIGEDAAHVVYSSAANDPASASATSTQQGAVAKGDGTGGAGTPFPMFYAEGWDDKATQSVKQVASMYFEPVFSKIHCGAYLDGITG